jgi:hypothetical protein
MTDHLEKIQSLTKDYTQFSKSKAGLGYLAMIPLFLLAYQLGKLLPPNFFGTVLGIVLSMAFFAVWWFIRGQVMLLLYQGFGLAKAAQVEYPKDFWKGVIVGSLAGIALAVLFRTLNRVSELPNTLIFAFPVLAFSVFVASGFYRTHGVMLASTAVLFGAAFAGGINSHASNMSNTNRVVPGNEIVIALLTLGFLINAINQHNDYKRLEQAFKNLSQRQP